ncbi:MAG: metallophosphoesterase [Candidatus Hydrogenedentales bacterium]
MKKLLVLLVMATIALRVFGLDQPAGGFSLSSTPLWAAADAKKDKVVVVSDIHLGILDKYSENLKNRAVFIEFLKRLGNTADVGELVIAGDFLDEWYLPLTYPAYSDSGEFYRQVVKNNQPVIDELNALMAKGVKLTYVPGNHDMTLEGDILALALPGINQARDVRGMGKHYTGARNEIVIEHGHRYDVYSAPDSVSNKDITGDAPSILPPGYFYARIAASWVLQGKPMIKKDLPEIAKAPNPQTDPDQFGAYLYYRIWSGEMNRITPYERFEDRVVDIKINGYNGKYSLKDVYPVVQADGAISAPTLYRNYQREWAQIQDNNLVAVKASFAESVAGALDSEYFLKQAKKQYLENSNQKIDVVVFGHTHNPMLRKLPNAGGKYYANSGTWIDENTYHPAASTFVVVTSGDETDIAELYEYHGDGAVVKLN